MKFKNKHIQENWIKNDYRKLACVEDDSEVTALNLDRDAVNKIASRNHLEREAVVEAILGSKLVEAATLGDAAEAELAKKLDAEIVNDEDDVKKELDRALATNKRLQRRGKTDGWSNILLTGEAGVGKTSRVKQWAAANGINLYTRKAGDLDVTDMGGAITPDKEGKRVNRLTSSEWDPLDRPNSVLFLDELNRASSEVRGLLLTLVNSHTVSDLSQPSGERFLPNFLFTIAAVNPSSADYNVDDLDDAEYDRFKEVSVIGNKRSLLKRLIADFDRDIATMTDEEDIAVLKGQKALAVALLSHKDFEFDTLKDKEKNREQGQRKSLSPRSFEAAINNCDGTKDDLLAVWSANCGARSKAMVDRILKEYKDIDDKANDALKGGTESEVFKKKVPLSQMLRDRIQGK